MAKIIAIRAFEDNFAITLDAPVDGIVVVKKDSMGNILETARDKKDTISLNAKHLRMMLYNDNAEIALIRAARESGFESRHVVAMLLNATCDIDAILHVAGEVDGEFVYEHDKYSYNLKNFKLSDRAQKMIDNAIAKMYDATDLFN